MNSSFKKVIPTAKGLEAAQGEVTGHSHAVRDYKDIDMYADEEGAVQLIETSRESFTVSHEEHNNIEIKTPIKKGAPEERGRINVGIVFEYDHLAEEARTVKD